MLVPGPAKKIIIHLNRDTSSVHDFLSNEILSLLFERGVAGATVLRPNAGFGSRHRLHGASGGIDADRHMPLRIEFVESQATVDALLPDLSALLTDGLIEAQDTVILKTAVGDGSENTDGEEVP